MLRRGYLLILVMSFVACSMLAQQPSTIKVRRESNLSKAHFENTERKLMVIDRFGNPRENEIVSYTLWVKTSKGTKGFDGFTNSLSPDMIRYLQKQGESCKLFFTDIKAKDDQGHIVPLPDVIEPWFPECKKNNR